MKNMTIQQIIESYLHLKHQITGKVNDLKVMRKQEQEIIKDIKAYLNENGETGVRLDEHTYISLTNQEKKISYNKKEYQYRVKALLYNRGIDDEAFMKELLDKTCDTVQEQKLKINKER